MDDLRRMEVGFTEKMPSDLYFRHAPATVGPIVLGTTRGLCGPVLNSSQTWGPTWPGRTILVNCPKCVKIIKES